MEELYPNDPIPNKKKYFHIIILTIIILTIIIILALAIYLILPKQSSTQTTEETIQSSSKILSKVQECATEKPDQICQALYTTPDIEAKCLKLDKEKDQCLYNFATINQRQNTCEKITNLELKTKCQEQIQIFFISEQ